MRNIILATILLSACTSQDDGNTNPYGNVAMDATCPNGLAESGSTLCVVFDRLDAPSVGEVCDNLPADDGQPGHDPLCELACDRQALHMAATLAGGAQSQLCESGGDHPVLYYVIAQ
jgi:hypothetical protein